MASNKHHARTLCVYMMLAPAKEYAYYYIENPFYAELARTEERRPISLFIIERTGDEVVDHMALERFQYWLTLIFVPALAYRARGLIHHDVHYVYRGDYSWWPSMKMHERYFTMECAILSAAVIAKLAHTDVTSDPYLSEYWVSNVKLSPGWRQHLSSSSSPPEAGLTLPSVVKSEY